ncbi:hypothetical protein FNV43_RR23468 [Rhamnella rubrinervis]|uniref:BRCT domain-containing protein n=1 Tax=Rhamnella rubrinervis TaxID=2594499 RepID=A0A8K0GT03_9ROSA|nr:hypothetical protein FNV43_RR23468 [Rhamnella rubrinervis]
MAVDSRTQPFSSPSGYQIKDDNEDDQPELPDTVAPDSPLIETSLDNLGFDTELIDDSAWVCEYEEEVVVLDSEDEEIDGRRPMSIASVLPDNEAGKGIKGCGLGSQPGKLGRPCKLADDKVTNFHVYACEQGCEGNEVSAEKLEEQAGSKSTEKQSEASGNGGETFDLYDIGFDTQMAAEAIEFLAYGPTIGRSAADAYQGTYNTVNDSLRGVTDERDHSKFHSLPLTTYDIGEIARHAKRKKRSARKFCRGTSIPAKRQSEFLELDSGLATKKQVKNRLKLFGETRLCCNSANENQNSVRRLPKRIKQRKAEGDSRRNKLRVFRNKSSSVPVEDMPLGKGQSQGHCVTVSPVSDKSRQSELRGRLKKSGDQSFNSGERITHMMEHDILVYRRRRSRFISDPYEISSGGNCSKLCYSIVEAKTSKLTNFSNLEIWSYTRRKRTRCTRPNHSIFSINLNASLRLVDGKDSNLQCQERVLSNSDMKCKSQSSSGTAPCALWHSSEDGSNGSFLGQNSDKLSSAGSTVCARAITNMRVSPKGSALPQASMQFGKADDTDSTSLTESVERNYMSIAVSNKTLQPSDSECITTFNSKSGKNVESSDHPCNRNVPKSALLRELIRLGVPESIPVLSWKDLRRKKDLAHVRVLFSQHLDDDIISRKRLGISIASDSENATHFVANKFVRTGNMLETIALGKPVVTHLWLESCGQASCFIDEKNYILRDSKKEKEIGFSMPVSLARANQHPLLKGQRVFITPNIKPDIETLTRLIKAVHGQPVEKVQVSDLKYKRIPDDLFVLSCKDDQAICLPFLEIGASVYSSELLLNGIVIQKLEYERHRLFTKHVRRNCP